ncbi:MAG: amidase [Verrucomicrobiota bacterium]
MPFPINPVFPARMISGVMFTIMLTGCGSWPYGGKATRDKAFISYRPPREGGGLRLAVKDLIDLKGEVTTAGSEYLAKNAAPATRDAACMAIARERNVQIVGKTNLTEFAASVTGQNAYYGTPVNRWDGKHRFIPGGSSSGSAVAVANGSADVAFGTDSGGSIRVPAAFCGIYGLKTTFGLVSTQGVLPMSPKYLDTVGPMAADVPHLVEGMDLLERGFRAKYQNAVAEKPSARQIRIGRLYIPGTAAAIDKAIDEALAATGFKVVKLDENFRRAWAQADADGETVATSEIWNSDKQYLGKPGVARTTATVITVGSLSEAVGFDAALQRKRPWQRTLAATFRKVDFIATPTLTVLPPRRLLFGSSAIDEKLVFNAQNTVGINFSGNPAIAIPIAMPAEKDFIPRTSLQLVGPNRSEAQLVNAARLVAAKN